MEHIQLRLEKSWIPVVHPEQAAMGKPLFTTDCAAAANLAAKGGEEWYLPFYARGGIFVGDLDVVTAEAAVDKFRIDISRTIGDTIQSALALKGDW